MGPKSKSKVRSARHDGHRKSLASPSDRMQKLKCSQHYSHTRMLELNQKRLQIRYSSIACLPCAVEGKTKSARRYDNGDSWVCLECRHRFCGGGGFEPEGHVRSHHKEEPEHRWFANSKNTDVHCCECNQEVPLKVFKYRPSQNKDTSKSTEASIGLGPITDQLDQKELDSNRGTAKSAEASIGLGPITDQLDPKEDDDGGLGPNTNTFDLKDDDGLDKKEVVTPQMKAVEAEDKGSSSPSSPHSEDITKEPVSICQPEEIAKEDVAKYNVVRGLPNAGNTCFFNAMLQCLLALDPLRSIMTGRKICTGPIAVLLKQLFVDTSASSNAQDSLDQRKLFAFVCSRWPQFSSGGMEDAEELIQHFLHALDEEEDETRQPSMDASKKVTVVNSIFAGEECSAISSTECAHGSDKRQSTLVFRLPIPDRKLTAVASRSNETDAEVHDGDAHVSIEDCFSLYTEKELVPNWFCQSCTDTANTNASETKPVVESGGDDNQEQETTKVHRAARKRLLITSAPDVMVISLIRQQNAPNLDGYVKLEGHVRFKEILDMQPYMDKRFDENDKNTYRLVGVAQHLGDRKGGHYIAYVRANKMNGQEHQTNDKFWFYASDKIIREASLQEVLGCEAYILFYERCSTHEAQSSSANVTSEEPRLDGIDLLPMMPNLVGDVIPPPMDELVQWDEQRSRNRDNRREQEADKKNATLLPLFWGFLDQFTLSEEKKPYYRFQLWGMLVRGCGSRELYILYSHLLTWSKDLAMGVCNGDERLRVKLTEIARKYMLELVTSLNMVVAESARNLMQQLELRFLEMPKKHEELKESLGADLLRKMDVYGHVGKQIMIPLPDKCALIQGLTEYVISKHRAGYSWEGDFGIEDMDAYDGKVVITKSPKLFEILPRISPEMVTAMEKDFDSIATKVLKKFIYPQIYVPYVIPFRIFLSGMGQYAKWWSDRVMTKDLRELILHYPFFKPLRARLNLVVGIFDAWRSFDEKDMSPLFKRILEKTHGFDWLKDMTSVLNQIILDVFRYKGNHVNYYETKLHFLIELLRHLAVHGTEKSFDYQCADGSRKQMVQTLDELEVGGAYYLEKFVVAALTALLEESAMKDMLESVWECYKNCNYPSQN